MIEQLRGRRIVLPGYQDNLCTGKLSLECAQHAGEQERVTYRGSFEYPNSLYFCATRRLILRQDGQRNYRRDAHIAVQYACNG